MNHKMNMCMKKMILVSLMTLCLPALTMAQSAGDDLYFIPKKKKAKVVAPQKERSTTVYAAPGSTVVIKDVKGNVRDVDEYNRRYTSRDNTFSLENDTLYIEEKPYSERGEWVNGFEGSQSDYEYAMRIVRFRNPRYAIPVSSPLYWDVVYGAYPSWDWNVYDDGMYAYIFPTYTNRLWWNWRFNYPYGPSWSFSWGWHSPWYYNSWHSPHYWGGWWGHHPNPHFHHPHYYPHHSGGYWGGGHGWYGSSKRNPGIHAGRYTNNYGSASANRQNYLNNGSNNRNNRSNYTGGSRQDNRNSANAYRNRNSSSQGRVVSGDQGSSQSVRPNRTAVRNQSTAGQGNTYTRSTESRGSSYTRPSSTRTSVTNQRSDGAAQRNAYRKDNSSSNQRSSSYSRSSSSSRRDSESSYSRSSSSSSSRSSYSGGSNSSSRSSAGGSSSRSSSGGRSGGGRTR